MWIHQNLPSYTGCTGSLLFNRGHVQICILHLFDLLHSYVLNIKKVSQQGISHAVFVFSNHIQLIGLFTANFCFIHQKDPLNVHWELHHEWCDLCLLFQISELIYCFLNHCSSMYHWCFWKQKSWSSHIVLSSSKIPFQLSPVLFCTLLSSFFVPGWSFSWTGRAVSLICLFVWVWVCVRACVCVVV